jgi:hypothetical protein
MVDQRWLRAEAARQGLVLTDDDFLAIVSQLEKSKAALAALRPEETERLEPAHQFSPRMVRA